MSHRANPLAARTLAALVALATIGGPALALAADTVPLPPHPPADVLQDDAPAPKRLQDGPPPYSRPLLRLAEVMGALAVLRDLCGAHDGAVWRKRMQDLLDGEPSGSAFRAELAGTFNRAYRTYAETTRGCTSQVADQTASYLAESGRLARDLAGRYAE